jgi:hypothetical protein
MCNQVCNANISYHGTMRWWRAVYSPHDWFYYDGRRYKLYVRYGPNVVKTNETVTWRIRWRHILQNQCGAHCTSSNDIECLEDVKRLLSYLQSK